jgi:hypothetical protein
MPSGVPGMPPNPGSEGTRAASRYVHGVEQIAVWQTVSDGTDSVLDQARGWHLRHARRRKAGAPDSEKRRRHQEWL